MGNWTIVIPAAGTNLWTNPSFEMNLTGVSANAAGTTLSQDSTKAAWGIYSLKALCDGTAASQGWLSPTGVSAIISVTAGQTYTFSAHFIGSASFSLTIGIQYYDNAGNTTGTTTANVAISSSVFTRQSISVLAPATSTKASVFAYQVVQAADTFWTDGIVFESGSTPTTYIDGDQLGCYWNGIAHGSTSTRDAQYRLGGREVDLETTYNIKVVNVHGMGMAPLQNNIQAMALQPGAIYQSNKILPRSLDLIISTNTNEQDAITLLHQRRDNLINLLAPDIYRGSQPILIGYTGASGTRTVYGQYRYDAGLEFGDLSGRNESIPIRLLAVDPLLYEQTQEVAALNFTASLAADYAFARINGTWQRLGSGFDNLCYCVAIDYQHNRIYFGGKFITANGVTVNGIAYWDGTTFQPLGAATKGIGVAGVATVYTIAIAPNGDIWAGGNFTAAGGSATKGLAKWAYPGTGAPTVYNTATTFTSIRSIIIDKNYRVYIGGVFTVFMGTANASYFCYSSDQGSTWIAPTATPASGGTPRVNTLALDTNGVAVYLAGDFTDIAGVSNTARVARFDGITTFTALSTGRSAEVYALCVSPDGSLYAGGTFTNNLAKWNGVSWTTIDTTLSSNVWGISYDYLNSTVVYISATTALKIYNGSISSNYDITPSNSFGLTIAQVLVNRFNADVYIVNGDLSPAASATKSGITTVTPSSSSQTYPIITITGTTTASSSSTLNFIENQSARQRLYFNLTILAGETITIDLQPGVKTVTSDWRGRIYGQPLSGSDLANFCLLPGANTIACYLSGTTTGCNVIMRWLPSHWGVDGVSQ